MKRLIYFISLLFIMSACDSNEPKLFEKDDTNAYFPESKLGVTVGNILSIPVTLSRLPGGGPLTVDFTIKDSTACEGVDYILRTPSCTFEKGHGTSYIVIEAIEKESDSIARRVFTITLNPVEGFKHNARNEITVELRNYSNHPLKHMLGDALFKGRDFAQNSTAVEFPVNIYPDSENDMTLYISGITGGQFGGVLPDLELAVDTNLNQLLILPKVFVNRKMGNVNGDIELVRGELQGNSVALKGSEPIRCIYDKDGNILFEDWFGSIWNTGSEAENLLFLYYGKYQGQYQSGILRKK